MWSPSIRECEASAMTKRLREIDDQGLGEEEEAEQEQHQDQVQHSGGIASGRGMADARAAPQGRWRDLDCLLLRPGPLTGPGFEPGPEMREMLQNDCKVLVIGAGGLGCELLKDLALSGFGNIEVIDMDTIDVSNLNRQFLFRMPDVGKPKAVVAAERIMQRVRGVNVVPHFCRIEDKDVEFYRQFQIIVLGLDSLEARSYINSVVCGFLDYEADGSPDLSTVKPMVDGGTEGFKGHARTPRSPVHCIEYVHLIQWGQDRTGDEFDADNSEHMRWIYEQALKRADVFNISGVTYSLTQGVVKNIIPAIASTNAIVAAACALETLKIATMCTRGMDNYMMYVGTQGVYTYTGCYDRNEVCLVCSPGVPLEVDSSITLQKFMDMLVKDARFEGKIFKPSISHGGNNLYMQAPQVLEEMTRPNLGESLFSLMGGSGGGVINVNDKKLAGVLRLRVSFREEGGAVDMDTAGGG